VKTSDITDGLGNTFFAGEKSLCNSDVITVGGQSGKTGTYFDSLDPGDDNSALQGFDHDTVRWCTTGMPPLQDTIGVSTTTNSFGSAHPAGCPFVFCDAHVQLITYNIDPNVYQNLACRNDGQVGENYDNAFEVRGTCVPAARP